MLHRLLFALMLLRDAFRSSQLGKPRLLGAVAFTMAPRASENSFRRPLKTPEVEASQALIYLVNSSDSETRRAHSCGLAFGSILEWPLWRVWGPLWEVLWRLGAAGSSLCIFGIFEGLRSESAAHTWLSGSRRTPRQLVLVCKTAAGLGAALVRGLQFLDSVKTCGFKSGIPVVPLGGKQVRFRGVAEDRGFHSLLMRPLHLMVEKSPSNCSLSKTSDSELPIASGRPRTFGIWSPIGTAFAPKPLHRCSNSVRLCTITAPKTASQDVFLEGAELSVLFKGWGPVATPAPSSTPFESWQARSALGRFITAAEPPIRILHK